jgi:hypothetical protein
MESVYPQPEERISLLRNALAESGLKITAFYLPQFHVIPENERWWGKGFTEWTLVKRAGRLFDGHDQPKVPLGDLGYYDLLQPRIFERQASLANDFGVGAFSFYHYWFNGKRLLDEPIELFLSNQDINIGFCLAWANEPWTRSWDGSDHEILQRQSYGGPDMWRKHFKYLLRAFEDKRALRIDGKPVLLIYRFGHIPCRSAMIDCWRSEAQKAGLAGVFLVGMISGFNDAGIDSYSILDAVCEFGPFSPDVFRKRGHRGLFRSYDTAWNRLLRVKRIHKQQFRGAFVAWDNTARRGARGVVFLGSTPAKYENYLRHQIRKSIREREGRRLLFINAWNEWGEGCYLEPDRTDGMGYLEATRNAIIEECFPLCKVKDKTI